MNQFVITKTKKKMGHFNNVVNGNGYNEETQKSQYTNAHFSYKGRSVIIDYEWYLHLYEHIHIECREKMVPFEMYPYKEDIYVGYAPLDEDFKKADISKIIEEIDKALEEESDK